MQPDNILTLAQYINDLKRRDRDRDRASEQPAFDTTTEDDAHWDQRDRSRDAGRSKDHPG
jgi:hypothetical protein